MSKHKYIWDDMAKSFHAFSSSSRAHKEKYSVIAKIILDADPENVLDLGCGSGLLESELIKLGYKGKIYAVDNSSEMLRIARKVKDSNIIFKKMDFDKKFDIQDRFDIIVAVNVFFFLKNKKRFLKNIKNSLKSPKSFLILVNPKPNDECDNWQFIKSHFANVSLVKKFRLLLGGIVSAPQYIKMVRGQANLSKMADDGKIVFNRKDDIRNMADDVGLEIKKTEDIHAGQNWLFIMKVKK